MPIAIVMSLQNAIPAILAEDTAQELVARLQGLQEAPELADEAAARIWLQSLPAPSGWFVSIEEAKAHVKRYHEAVPIIPGATIREAREALGMPRDAFAEALGIGGNPNTRHKTIFDIEREAINKSSGKPRVLNPSAVKRLQALMAERGLDLLGD